MYRRSGYVYTDGACSNNGYTRARAGVGVYWGNQRPDNISARLRGRQTNNSAELGAIIIALRQAIEEDFDQVTIYTDSQFIIDCINEHLPRWSKNGWKKSNRKPVVNQCDFQCILRLMDRIDVHFRKVEAHSGNFGNDEADRFAREGCRMQLDAYSSYDYHSDYESDYDY